MGNVAILPQDVAKVRSVLPPDRSEIEQAMCTLFVGSDIVPSRDNIKKLGPVLVSKSRVSTMLDFLLSRSSWYLGAGVRYSQENMNDLFDTEDSSSDVAVPKAVELCCLPDDRGASSSTSGYSDRGGNDAGPDDLSEKHVVMEAVGYTVGDRTPKDYETMKATALAWCLDRKKFIKVQLGSKFISDRDSGLLTYTFPHLDPWGIGGFYEPMRSQSQYITFKRQVRNLLQQQTLLFSVTLILPMCVGISCRKTR